MPLKYVLSAAVALLLAFAPGSTRAQGKTASVKALRCTFAVVGVSTWNKDGLPETSAKSSKLVLRFASINPEEGTAQLMNGTVGSGVTVKLMGGNLHFIQSFRSGALYFTTVFDRQTSDGKLKAVHSRHEYFNAAVEGTTSSPEQYYGDCEIVS